MQKFSLSVGFMLVAMLFAGGCASVSMPVAPGDGLKRARSFYVVKREGDKKELNTLVRDAIKARGYQASTGNLTRPSHYDVKVTYKDDWMWDITTYLLSLEIQFENPSTGEILAAGRSYRPSLQRKEPQFMVNEVMDQVLGPVEAEE